MSACTTLFFLHISPSHHHHHCDRQDFFSNLPRQGENISIKQRLPWQTSLVPDNLSDQGVFLSTQLGLVSFRSLCCFWLSFTTTNSPLFLPYQYFYSDLKCLYVRGCLLSLTQSLSPFCPAAVTFWPNISRDWRTLLDVSWMNSCTSNFFSFCLHRCTMPVFTSGWMEVSSDGQAQHHW